MNFKASPAGVFNFNSSNLLSKCYRFASDLLHFCYL